MNWSPLIREKLDKVLAVKGSSKTAVFDADGTLWHADLGDAFFKYQADHRLAPGLEGIKDPWAHYKTLCSSDHETAYGWLAQINEGVPEKALQKQAHDFYWNHFSDKPVTIMRALLRQLEGAGFEIWVCSASHRWALEPALDDLGLSLKRLIAVEVAVRKGLLTGEIVSPIPYKAGKRFWIEKKLQEPPTLVAGNSMGDIDMLSLASELPLLIVHTPHLPDIKDSEEAAIKEAVGRGWPIQIF